MHGGSLVICLRQNFGELIDREQAMMKLSDLLPCHQKQHLVLASQPASQVGVKIK